MSFLKRFFCTHEVDMGNLEKPLCKKCSYEFPTVLINRHGFEANPALNRWFVAKNAPKYAALAKALKDSHD